MKFLLVLLLAGLGIAAAIPISITNDVQFYGDINDEIRNIFHAAEGNEVKSELGKKLRSHFDEILEQIRDIIDNGKTYKEELIENAKEIRQKLIDLGMDIGNHAKELIKKLKVKAKDYWQRILDKLHSDNEIYFDDDENDMKTELGRKLRAHLDEILDHIRDIVENGRAYRDDLVKKAEEIHHHLKELKVGISNHAKQVIENLKSKATGLWKKFLGRFYSNSDVAFADDDNDVKIELGKKLRAHFDEILEHIRDIIDNGKAYRDDLVEKAKEIRQELKAMGMDIAHHAKEKIKQLKIKAKDYWKKILDKLHSDTEIAYSDDDNDMKTELGKKLKAHLEEILEHISDIVENGRAYSEDLAKKAEEIRQHLREIKVDISNHAKELIERLKSKAKGLWKKLLNKLHPSSEIAFSADEEDEFDRNLKNSFHDILEKLKEAFENRKVIGANVISKFQEIWAEMKERSIPLDDRAKDLIEQLKERGNLFWKKILDRITNYNGKA